MLNGNVISWLSKSQTTVALSSAESEYSALTETVKELIYYQQWLTEIATITNIIKLETPLIIYTDNEAAKAIAKNDQLHSRTKHIDIKHHFIRDEIEKERIKIEWISTKEQLADLLTKKLSNDQFKYFITKLMDGEINTILYKNKLEREKIKNKGKLKLIN